MSVQNFIIDKLCGFSAKFENYQFTYWNDSNSKASFIEVIPEIFHNNADFVEEELLLIEEFYANFPLESLAFVSTDQRNMVSDVVKVRTFNTLPTITAS
jgi:hypothetical protein